jgi:hypothetical protein
MREWVSFNNVRVLLWIIAGVVGLAFAAQACPTCRGDCQDGSTCGQSCTITSDYWTDHCCCEGCDQPSYPNCGGMREVHVFIGSCPGTGGCEGKEYGPPWSYCDCGGTCP